MYIRNYIMGDKVIFRKWVLYSDFRNIKGVISKISQHGLGDVAFFYRMSYIGENNKQKTCNLFPKGDNLYELGRNESMTLDMQAIREDEINKILN